MRNSIFSKTRSHELKNIVLETSTLANCRQLEMIGIRDECRVYFDVVFVLSFV